MWPAFAILNEDYYDYEEIIIVGFFVPFMRVWECIGSATGGHSSARACEYAGRGRAKNAGTAYSV